MAQARYRNNAGRVVSIQEGSGIQPYFEQSPRWTRDDGAALTQVAHPNPARNQEENAPARDESATDTGERANLTRPATE